MADMRIVRKGEGDVVAPWCVKSSGDLSDGRFDLFVGEVDYLAGPPLHRHDDQEDTFYVLEGILTVQGDEEIFEAGPGDFVTFPPGVAHTFDNLKEDQPPVKVMNIMTPGGFDRAIRALNALGDKSADPGEWQELRREFRLEFVGPPIHVRLGLK